LQSETQGPTGRREKARKGDPKIRDHLTLIENNSEYSLWIVKKRQVPEKRGEQEERKGPSEERGSSKGLHRATWAPKIEPEDKKKKSGDEEER